MTYHKAVHLFNVHSHITYLMACAVIRYRDIDHDDAVFLTRDDYSFPENAIDIRTVTIPKPYFLLDFYYGWNYPKIRNNMAELAGFIDRVTEGREYVWYMPHTSAPYQKIIASYDQCLSYCVIEEGVSLHQNLDKLLYPLPPHNKWLMKLCNENRIDFLDDHYICVENSKYDCMFVSFDSNFATIKNRVVLTDVFAKERNSPFESADAVLIFDKAARILRGGIDSYQESLNWLLENHFRENRFKKVLCRARARGNHLHSENYISEVLERYPEISFEWIKDSVVMENMIYTYDIPYYFLASSLGCYAAALGRKAFSYSPTFKAMEPNYKYHLERKGVSDECFLRYGVNLLPAETREGDPLPVVSDSWGRFAKREGIRYAKKFVPLSILKTLQKLAPNF